MGKFIKGEVVVLPFPFSDLSASKKRPALVAATLSGDDLILCQITSHPIRDTYAISLELSDFQAGGLNQSSQIRPNRLFTADSKIIRYGVGVVSASKLQEVTQALIQLFA
jgi:mRNA interferase MazF